MNDEQQLAVAQRIGGLIFKYLNESLTADELTDLHNWAYSSKENQELFEGLIHSEELQHATDFVSQIDKATALRYIQEQVGHAPAKVVRMPAARRRYWVAAAVLLALIAGMVSVYYLGISRKDDNPPLQTAQTNTHDAAPGGNKAVLTLANGNTIILDNAHNGTLGQQGNTQVLKIANGQLAYTTAPQPTEILNYNTLSTLNYNTLSTPRGGQYQVVLPDGSKVWLNASSSLRYPTAFAGEEREVELTGEGYFEVAKNAARPFKVKVKGMTVNVMGTSFNVMAYDEEGVIKTTLLTGSVKVAQSNGDNKLLKPGDQARIAEDGKIAVRSGVDEDNVIAWKNGYFYFDKADLKTLLRELSRWYDVEVEYVGAVPNQHFAGKIQRNLLLSQVLEILASNQVHFRIEGKKLTVLP